MMIDMATHSPVPGRLQTTGGSELPPVVRSVVGVVGCGMGGAQGWAAVVVFPISLFIRAREVSEPSGFSHQRQGSKQTGHFILSAHSMQTLFLHGRTTRLAFFPQP